MEAVDTLIQARWVVPVEPEGAVYAHHAVALRDGRILAIVPATEADARFDAESTVHLDRHALIPGLINAHTHAPMVLMRGMADDLPLWEWLTEHIWPAEMRWVREDFVRDGTRLAAGEMLRGGITCFNDMYFFPDVAGRVVSEIGMRACLGMILVDFPTAWADGPETYISKGLALHDAYRDHPLITTAFAPHAPYTVSDAPLERVRVLADELDVPVHIHVHETAYEVNQGLEQSGERPLDRLERLGLLSPALLAVHMTQLTDGEIERVAAAGASVIHCPEANLKLASGFCPAHRLMVAGVNVALGTDGAASNNDLNLFGELRTAALLAKAVAGEATALPATTVLRMATLNGARALGIDADTGSLVPGKSADLVAVDLGALEQQPVYNPLSQLVYATDRGCVTDVWVNGRQLLKGRALTTLDEDELVDRAEHWRGRMAETP